MMEEENVLTNETPAEQPQDPNLKRKAFSSTFWKFLERIIAQGVTLIVSIIIARILDPEDYSVISVVLIFFNFANVFISGGFNTALIQKKDSDSLDYSSVLWVTLGISVVIYLALFFTAPYIAIIFDKEILTIVIRIMGLTLPIAGIKSIWTAYISQTLNFKKFFFATIGGTAVSAVVGIWMALAGYGVWALVAQQMVNTAIDTIILIVTTRIHIRLTVSMPRIKVLFKYGWKVFVSSLVNTAYGESTSFIIGIRYEAADLSYYTKGKRFPDTICSSLTSTFSAVLFPVLAKVQDNKEKVLHYTRMFMRLCSFVLFPAMLGFLALADTFVMVLLTEKWMGAVFYIQLFCVCCMFDVVAVGNCESIKAIGRSGVFLIMEIIKKTLYLGIIIAFVFLSPSAEIMAISAAACVVVQILVNSIPNVKLINYKIRYQIWDLLPNLLMSVVMAAAVWGFGYLNKQFMHINLIVVLILQLLIGVVLYLGMSILTRNKSYIYLKDNAVKFIKGRSHHE